MIELAREQYKTALARYHDSADFFPLIAAVLLRTQDGLVYADDDDEPQQFYVEHAFGFAQIYGKSQLAFEKALEDYLFVSKRFAAAKVRLYGVDAPAFLSNARYDSHRSIRQRFRRVAEPAVDEGLHNRFAVVVVDERSLDALERTFGVVTRFWRSAADFVRNAIACVVTHEGEMASLCYGAAVAEGKAEIDVLTVTTKRRIGAAKIAVNAFAARCSMLSIEPLWDCFTNNAGSMALALATGFRPSRPPYPFYTVSR